MASTTKTTTTPRIRKASMADYDGIMAIDKNSVIYGGYDYLPREFPDFIRRHEGYVLLADHKSNDNNDNTAAVEEIIGFLGVIITDGGKSFALIGGRIRADFQNRGFFRFLVSAVTEATVAAHPAVTTRRMSVGVYNPHLNRLLQSHDVVTRGFFLFLTPLQWEERKKSWGSRGGGDFKVVSKMQKVRKCLKKKKNAR